jgi:hypothetical protein
MIEMALGHERSVTVLSYLRTGSMTRPNLGGLSMEAKRVSIFPVQET